MSTGYHENGLSEKAKEIHRALASLQEELEAVDWYNQRVDVSDDDGLRAILEHNRNEEIEHAAMALEYLRRNFPEFDEHLRTYLFTSAPVTELEEGEDDTGGSAEAGAGGDLGIGKVK
ncbi:MAG: encapsulin-associated ferritin-like protein [Verrucomicrobiota bacterium]